MINNWIKKILLNSILVFGLTSVFTYAIGYLVSAEIHTSHMVFEIGLMILLPAILLNVLFLTLSIFIRDLWLKILFAFIPVIVVLIVLIMGINAAWTPLAILISLVIMNSIWIHQMRKLTANNK